MELRIYVAGRPVPQGRVRVPRYGKPYYPKTSVAYREELVKAFRQASEEGGWKKPRGQAWVNLYVVGMRRTGDGDNILKQVMDALVEADIIKADNWEAVPFQLVSCRKAAKGEAPHVMVYVTKAVN